MAGLVGIYKRSGLANINQLATAMLESVSTKAYLYKSLKVIDDYACFGYAGLKETDFSRMPISTKDGLSLIIIAGEVWDYKSGDYSPEKMNDLIEAIAGELRNNNLKYVENLEGAYSLACFDRRAETLIIVNDRFGLYPIYFKLMGEMLIFASEVKALLATGLIQKQLNNNAMAEIFHFGHVLGGKSFIKDINQLPPASILIYDGHGLKLLKYWSPTVGLCTDTDECEVLKNEARDELLCSIKRTVSYPYKIGIALSGGTDSRVLAAALANQGIQLPSQTHGIRSAFDVELSKIIAKSAGFDHTVIDLDDNEIHTNIIEYIQEVSYISDGFLTPILAHLPHVYTKEKEKVGALIDGSGGEYLRRAFLKKGILAKTKKGQEIPLALFSMYANQCNDKLLEPGVARDFHMKAKNGFLDAWQSLDETRNFEDKIDLFFIKEKIPAYIGTGNAYQRNYLVGLYPFFHYPFWQKAVNLPLNFRKNDKLHRFLIKGLYPELSKIPYDVAGYKLPHYLRGYPRHVSLFVLRRYGKKIGLDKRTYTDYPRWLRNSGSQWIRDLLLYGKIMNNGLLNTKEVESFLKNFFKGVSDDIFSLAALLSMELFHRQFIYSKKPEMLVL